MGWNPIKDVSNWVESAADWVEDNWENLALTVGTLGLYSAVWAADALTDAAVRALTPDISIPTREMEDIRRLSRGTTTPRRIIYGRTKVSGQIAYMAESGANKEYINLVVLLAGHEVEEIGDLYLNEVISSDARFAGKVIKYNKHLGSPTQTADADLIAATAGTSAPWTTAHRLRGIAYVYIQLLFSRDAFPTGIPTPSCVVRGKKDIYDPRSGLYGYTDNWALCVHDYMRFKYGMFADADEVDIDSITAAANISDELVATNNTGGTEKRYTCNGALNIDSTPIEGLKKLLTGGAGNAVFQQGKWYLYAGAYRAPSFDLDENDLSGGLAVKTGADKGSKINTIKGTFVDPLNYYQTSEFPAVTSAAYVAADGEELTHEMAMPFTNSGTRAQRIAKIIMERSRRALSVSYPCKYTAVPIAPMDSGTVSNSRLGWTDKEFKCMSWEYSITGAVKLGMVEESADIYTWLPTDPVTLPAVPQTSLPSPWIVETPGGLNVVESLYTTNTSSVVMSRATFTWSPGDVSVLRYEVQGKGPDNADFVPLGESVDNKFIIDDIKPGQWSLRVRAVNGTTKGGYATINPYIYGKTAPPSDITNFYAQPASGGLRLSWDAVDDLDIDRYRIKYHPDPNMAAWANSSLLLDSYSTSQTLIAAKNGVYLIKALDTSGNESVNARTVTTDIPAMLVYNAVATLTQEPAFSGIKTGFLMDGGRLIMDGAGTFDDIADLDAATNLDFYGGVVTTATYESAPYDIGSVQVCRCYADVIYTAVDAESLFDNIEDFDGMTNFDGEVTGIAVDFEIATSQDNIAWGDWQNLGVADFSARAYKFRFHAHGSGTKRAEVTSLVFNIDIPDRREGGVLTTAAGGSSVTFLRQYITTPRIMLTIQNANEGDAPLPTNITTGGFDIQVKNNGSGVSRVVGWDSVGY